MHYYKQVLKEKTPPFWRFALPPTSPQVKKHNQGKKICIFQETFRKAYNLIFSFWRECTNSKHNIVYFMNEKKGPKIKLIPTQEGGWRNEDGWKTIGGEPKWEGSTTSVRAGFVSTDPNANGLVVHVNTQHRKLPCPRKSFENWDAEGYKGAFFVPFQPCLFWEGYIGGFGK